jgi:hypothetical protein
VNTRSLRAAWALPLVVMVALCTAVIAPSASADTASDPRATFHDAANATTCAEVGFPNDTILGSGGGPQANGTVTADANFSVTVSAYTGANAGEDSQKINVTALTSGFVIDAVIVKGGNGYNQYSSAVADMIAPLNNGGNVPNISHWFLCYHAETPVVPPGPGPDVGPSVTPQAPTVAPTVAAPRFTG